MDAESRKLKRAIEIMKMMAEGLNPFTSEPYDENTFLNDPRMVRCLYYVIEILEKMEAGEIGQFVEKKDLPFIITQEEKAKVVLPEEKIGVNTFAKCINQVINPLKSRKLTGVLLNNQLKKMGILSEEETEGGKHRTAVNDTSIQYGIEIMEANYNGNLYEKVVFNDKGKKFLLEHLEEIMNYK